MRYRVNLYGERGERLGRLRAGLFRGSLLGAVVGIEVILLGLLAVSGFQLQERSKEHRHSIEVVEEQIAAIPPVEAADPARALLRERVSRIDWAGAMQAVGRSIPKELVLTELRGEGKRQDRRELVLKGRVVSGPEDLSGVFEFINTLREDSLLTRTFPVIDIGSVQGEGEQSFQIICRAPSGSGETS